MQFATRESQSQQTRNESTVERHKLEGAKKEQKWQGKREPEKSGAYVDEPVLQRVCRVGHCKGTVADVADGVLHVPLGRGHLKGREIVSYVLSVTNT